MSAIRSAWRVVVDVVDVQSAHQTAVSMYRIDCAVPAEDVTDEEREQLKTIAAWAARRIEGMLARRGVKRTGEKW